MEIVIGPIFSKITENLPLARTILQFKYLSYRQGTHGGKHEEWKKVVINKEGIFLTGYIPRLVKALSPHNIPITYHVTNPSPQPINTPMKTQVLREYQEEAVQTALKKKRGIILSSTGSGKTTIGIALAKQFPNQNILWIAPTIDLLSQTYKRLVEEFDEPEVGVIGDGTFEPSRVTVGIINSLYNYRLENNFLQNIGVVIVDEVHRVSSLSGMYSKTLQQTPAPIRIGLTATLPNGPEALFSMEGNLGPVIKEISMNHLVELGNLATPKVKIVRIPLDKDVSNLKKYTEVYDQGIVNNQKRNEIIIDEVAKYVLNGNTCLVVIRILEHGHNLFEIVKSKYPSIRALFASGITEAEERERIRSELQAKNIDLAITSTIFKEGVDIPSLDVIVNAASSKSELFTLQVLGRGMRTSPGKDHFIILDFFDPSSKYLIDHFGHRLSYYFEREWL